MRASGERRLAVATVVVALVILLGAAAVQAVPTAIRGDVATSEIRAPNQEIDRILYSVTFTTGSAVDLYELARGRYDFSSEAAAISAVDEVNAALEMADGFADVGLDVVGRARGVRGR
jgi:hypothetical protein